jgi:AcrR family transcriptional regulator
MSESGLGLRERKKRATRVALSDAALRLCAQRGVDNVTVDDIAAEVEVSTRTFFNYFSSKEAAVMADSDEHAVQMFAALLARPAGESIVVAERNAVLSVLDEVGEPSRTWAAQVRLVRTTPSLLPYQLAENTRVERELAAAVAQRTGMDRTRDMRPALVAASACAAVRVAAEAWMDRQSPLSLAELVTEAMDQLASGLPTP